MVENYTGPSLVKNVLKASLYNMMSKMKGTNEILIARMIF